MSRRKQSKPSRKVEAPAHVVTRVNERGEVVEVACEEVGEPGARLIRERDTHAFVRWVE